MKMWNLISVKISGLIGRNLEEHIPANWRMVHLDEYLKANNIVSIEDVDTRALVAHIRTKGAMNCIISSEITDIEELKKIWPKFLIWMGWNWLRRSVPKKAYEMGDKDGSDQYCSDGLWSVKKYSELHGGTWRFCKSVSC